LTGKLRNKSILSEEHLVELLVVDLLDGLSLFVNYCSLLGLALLVQDFSSSKNRSVRVQLGQQGKVLEWVSLSLEVSNVRLSVTDSSLDFIRVDDSSYISISNLRTREPITINPMGVT
jgi:hypothetical protein